MATFMTVQRVHDKAVHPGAEIYQLPVEIE